MSRFIASSEALAKAASAHEHLKQLAIHGDLRPHRRLSPNDLAAHFRVSMTPIRDALVQLSTEGFISFDRGRGYWVKPFTVEEQRQLHEINLIFLVAALERAAAQPPRDALEVLLDLPRELADLPPDPLARGQVCTERLEAFYAAMSRASGNAVLARLAGLMMEQTHLVRLLDLRQPTTVARFGEALPQAAEAMLAKDAARAAGVMRDLMAGRLERLEALVRLANAHAEAARFP
jgi:GntR family transcriptional regulator of vanillate catabolism